MHFSLFVLLFCMSLFCRFLFLFVFVVFLRSFLYSHFANYCRRLVDYNEHESVVRVRLRVLLQLLFSICWCSPLVFYIFFFFCRPTLNHPLPSLGTTLAFYFILVPHGVDNQEIPSAPSTFLTKQLSISAVVVAAALYIYQQWRRRRPTRRLKSPTKTKLLSLKRKQKYSGFVVVVVLVVNCCWLIWYF